jgi:CMP-2-keto-3-deoxyoctulosonic acid synthetase
MGSNRFPGKVLAPVKGRPLVVHVWERVKQARTIADVLVATDSEDVAMAIEA